MDNLVKNELPNFETKYTPMFSNFPVKTLVLWGEDDELLHCSGAQRLKDKLSDAEVVIIKKCGHAMQLDQPGRVIRHLKRFHKQNL